MLSAVCLGETMAMLTPVGAIPLHQATELHCGVGGAESNVAMGLAAMGLEAHWVGRVGNDGFGTRILDELRSHSVGVTGVEVDQDLPTGLYVKVPAQETDSDGGSSVLYYRQGSAASAMGPGTLANPAVGSLLEQAALIHLSGITAALSPECLELTEAILAAPREGTLISFDVNWRPALWEGRDRSVLRKLANMADIVLVGKDEAEHAFGTTDEAELRSLMPDPPVLVIKNEAISAIALSRDGSRAEVPALSVDVLEPVGAGDSFAAGYLSGVLFGLDQKASLRRGHVAAACTLTVHGDRGPLPEATELSAILESTDAQWAAIQVSGGHFNNNDRSVAP
ncbi:sugar kinase [Pseudarthrobacter sp. J75]|uniref:sugar kinase n=1 Tax=unclassified Pseudarthrobacter TaxID=2647000 RepID=UPI002E7FD8F5|nr:MULTISPECIES: sugar kinase [unclassified Pseudarthrobacter]MEE2522427.1 sugar kinase [Pseudarthrobacter sp. J47]MEE2529242.1 sugar kinase [Pseudarthrobacter sp. J75]